MSKLLETLLKSEFKFGFELEGYVSNYDDYSYGYEGEYEYNEVTGEYDEINSDENYDESIDYDTLYNELSILFSKTFGDECEVESDGSLGIGGFEFPSPIMSLTPINIKKCIEFLYNLPNNEFNIYTDETCGFHTHISFPNMSNEDMAWIVCHIALDPKIQDNLMLFKDSAGEEFDFFGKWATTDFLQDIESAIKMSDWEELSKWLSNEKYRVIRIHPQGTLEWRGPRDFLNKRNLQTIKDFFVRLSNVVLQIAKIMDKKEINGISRTNFFKLVKLTELSKQGKIKTLSDNAIKAIIKNPLILTKINQKINPLDLIKKLEFYLKQSGESLESFLIPLRYKEFKDNELLAIIIELCPSFINFVDTKNSKLFQLLGRHRFNIYDTFLNVDKLSPDIVVQCIKSHQQFFDTFLSGIQHRVQANKNIDSFLTPQVGKALLQRFKTKDSMDWKIKADKVLNDEIKNKLIQIIS